jgi:hypothetical protein
MPLGTPAADERDHAVVLEAISSGELPVIRDL